MADVHTYDLVLRFYGHKVVGNKWRGICLDLNIAAEADTKKELQEKLTHMILSYIETAIDTDDQDSIPDLLTRKAPFYDWSKYYVFKSLKSIKGLRNNFIFKRSIPFHLSRSC